MSSKKPDDGTKRQTIENYPYVTAGRTWIIPKVVLQEDPAGMKVLPGAEIERMQRSVANEICGHPAPLAPEELEFLCDTTCTPYVEVARFLDVSKGTVAFWKKPGKIVPLNESLRLKRWFWHKIFKSFAGRKEPGVPMDVFSDDRLLLPVLREIALKTKAAFALPGGRQEQRRKQQ